MLSNAAKLISGLGLIVVPTIQFGGSFLLKILSGRDGLELTEFQKSMFRAGHAHAGVLLILGVLAQVLADHASLPNPILWAVRIGFFVSPMLISGGFFGGGMGKTEPAGLIALLWIGAAILALSTVTLGVGLLRARV